MSEQDISAKLKKYRLSAAELEKIKGLLGRDPCGIEWALFSALWSEHCSYKSSKVHLRKFAQKSGRVLQSMGENAGVIDLGGDEKIAFKMESHNHPSFIEPYQGAATGVGGILRDIFTMGARPIALANYLCFGEPKAERMESLVEGVVSGIAGYGNCVGVPTVTGQTEFHSSYNDNILVNAFALGLFEKDDPIVVSQAKGVGNFVVYVGAKTGRDGVHGASMASESFAADSASKRPTVQIGDPFFEKLLIESCLEVMKKDLVVAIQDMGAAGLTSSSFEMAAKGGVGFRIHLDKVPLRDSSVGPEEILLSESQERMLLVCEPEKFETLKLAFEYWDLDAAILGEVTPGPEVELFWKGDMICRIDPKLLVENAPVYERPYSKWEPRHKKSALSPASLDMPATLGSVQGTSREWIYGQYDQRVGTKTVRDCSDSVAVMRLPTGRALGIVLGCRPQVMRLDARLGGYDAAFFPALELAAKGFEPLAMTDCLNFGNPEKPEIMTEFVASVEAMAEASRALEAPVISGNVSFYNETLGRNITSTPSTGLVGLRTSVHGIPSSNYQYTGDDILLWRLPGVSYQGDTQFTGDLDPALVARWLKDVREFVTVQPISATRVVGKFGISYALFRMSTETLGANVQLGDWSADVPAPWTTERLYEVLVVGGPDLQAKMKTAAAATGSQVYKLGTVKMGDLVLGMERHTLKQLHEVYKTGWGKNFGRLA